MVPCVAPSIVGGLEKGFGKQPTRVIVSLQSRAGPAYTPCSGADEAAAGAPSLGTATQPASVEDAQSLTGWAWLTSDADITVAG